MVWAALLAVSCMMGGMASAEKFHGWAATPPMGWNSWDCFGTGVTESQVRENAEYMAAKLKSHGWKVVTVDIDWCLPGAKGWDYRPNAPLAMDEYGRLLPTPDRFPSATAGKGFKPLADSIHAMGLKFGVHLMRGIPRNAVAQNTPIKGSAHRAADIANKNDACPWNPDMWGVDMSKPGAQAYYDSVMKLMAEWGVDFIKIDDLSTPYHQAEIEGIRKAIDGCGRPIVLSTSPGPTPIESGNHVQSHANMWRISGDFWDDWAALKEQFERVDRWTPFRGPGHWPDADMLPLGAVRQGQKNDWTNFTPIEQTTLMTLWSICRSPLILGGHLPRNDAFTLSLITNDEVLAINQKSSNNRQLWRNGDSIAWVADIPGSPDKYLALFNARDQHPLDLSHATFRSETITRSKPFVDIDVDISGAKKLYLFVDDAGDGIFADHAVWAEPRLQGKAGEIRLTELTWRSATQGYGQAAVNRSVVGKPLVLDSHPVGYGIGTHAKSMIEYDLPEGVTRFRARAGLENEGATLNGGGTIRFAVFAQEPTGGTDDPALTMAVPFSDLGFNGPVRVRDLWAHRDLGRFSTKFESAVPWHGARLFRLSPDK